MVSYMQYLFIVAFVSLGFIFHCADGLVVRKTKLQPMQPQFHEQFEEQNEHCKPFLRSDTVLSSSEPLAREYKPDLNCLRLLTAPLGYLVVATFEEGYNIEASSSSEECYDSVTFQDGPYAFSENITILCGHGARGISIKSTGPYLRIHFRTDSRVGASGFNITISFEHVSEEHVKPFCYFYLPTTEQTSLTIEERSVPAYYSRMALSRKIDCVWDIHHNGTNERFWLWIYDYKQSMLTDLRMRTVTIYEADTLWGELRAMSNRSHQVKTKLYPKSSRILIRVRAVEVTNIPTLYLNTTSYTEIDKGQEVKHGVYICKLGERRLGISKQLVCNGRLNCPNGEDEQLCDTIDTELSLLQLYMIIGGCALLLVIIALVVFCAGLVIKTKRFTIFSQLIRGHS